VIAAIVVVAAVLRLATLSTQSLWADEGFTARIATSSLGSAASQVPHTESTPPLYYAVEWLWVHVFGSSAFALRFPAALFGCMTVVVIWVVGVLIGGRLAGLIAAVFTATSPIMVWYSQEARSYALLVLLCVAALGFFVMARREPRTRWLVGWALCSAAALATHYFAVFPVVVEGGWLLIAQDRRRVAAAAAIPLLVGAALLPLALYQKDHVPRPWTSIYTVGDQVKAIAQSFFIGPTWTPIIHRAGLAALVLLALASVYALARSGPSRRRSWGGALAVLAALVLGLPLVLSLLGTNYLAPRNVLYAWPLLALVVALGAAGLPRRWMLTGVLAGSAIFIAITVAVASTSRLQRDDWRGLLASLGAPHGARAVIVVDGFTDDRVVQYYLPRLRVLRRPIGVSELDVVGSASEVAAFVRTPPVPGMAPLSVQIRGHIALARFVAPSGSLLPASLPAGSGSTLLA
jgi:mannosyltransferase